MQTITILIGLKNQNGEPLPAQMFYTDGLAPEDALLAIRQAEAQAIAGVVEAAEQRGREAAQCESPTS